MDVVDVTAPRHIVHKNIWLHEAWLLKDVRAVIEEHLVLDSFWFQHRNGWGDVTAKEEGTLQLESITTPRKRWLASSGTYHLHPRQAVIIRTGLIDTVFGGTMRENLFTHALCNTVPNRDEIFEHGDKQDYIRLTAFSLGVRARSVTFLSAFAAPSEAQIREVFNRDLIRVVRSYYRNGVLGGFSVDSLQRSPRCLDYLSRKNLVDWSHPSAEDPVAYLLSLSAFAAQVCLNHCRTSHLNTRNIEKPVLSVSEDRDPVHLRVLLSDSRVAMAASRSTRPILATASVRLPNGSGRLIKKMLRLHFFTGPSRIASNLYQGAGTLPGLSDTRRKLLLKHGCLDAGTVLSQPGEKGVREPVGVYHMDNLFTSKLVSPVLYNGIVALDSPELCGDIPWEVVFQWLPRPDWKRCAATSKGMLKRASWIGHTASPFLKVVERPGLETLPLLTGNDEKTLLKIVETGPLQILWRGKSWSPATALVSRSIDTTVVDRTAEILTERRGGVLGHFVPERNEFKESLLKHSIVRDHVPLFQICFAAIGDTSTRYADLPEKYATLHENMVLELTRRRSEKIFHHLFSIKQIPVTTDGLLVEYVAWFGLVQVEKLFEREIELSEEIITAEIRRGGTGLIGHTRDGLEAFAETVFLQSCFYGTLFVANRVEAMVSEECKTEGYKTAISMGHDITNSQLTYVLKSETQKVERRFLTKTLPSGCRLPGKKDTNPFSSGYHDTDDDDEDPLSVKRPRSILMLELRTKDMTPMDDDYEHEDSLWNLLPLKIRKKKNLPDTFLSKSVSLFSEHLHGTDLLEIVTTMSGRAAVPGWHSVYVIKLLMHSKISGSIGKQKPVQLIGRRMITEEFSMLLCLRCYVWGGCAYYPAPFAQVVLSVVTSKKLFASHDPGGDLVALLEGSDPFCGVYIFFCHDPERCSADITWILMYSHDSKKFSEPLLVSLPKFAREAPLPRPDLWCDLPSKSILSSWIRWGSEMDTPGDHPRFTLFRTARVRKEEQKEEEDEDFSHGTEEGSDEAEAEPSDEECPPFVLLKLPPFTAVPNSRLFMELD